MVNVKELVSVAFFGRCIHRSNYSRFFAILYCLALASAYVGALYILVPSKVRKLDRDHFRHIQYRIFASLFVSAGAVASYPFLFCASIAPVDESTNTFSLSDHVFRPRLRSVVGVLTHTMILYFGSILAGFLQVSDYRNAARARGQKTGTLPEESFRRMINPTLQPFVNPSSPEERWILIRNLIVAPWTEEVVFRGCIVPALLGSGMSPLRVALVSPFCFGVAHVHHAMTRLSKGERLQPVILMTAFQFVYTSLFGSYAAYAFVRTGSVPAVALSHAFCNWMGLPDFNFVQPTHPMYPHRRVLLAAFVFGVFGFKWGFSSGLLLPLPSQLPAAVHG